MHTDNQPPTSTTFETLGWYEDVACERTGRILGTRAVTEKQARGRVCGYHGMRYETVTSPLTLQCGHKTKTFPATKERPLRIRTTLQILCGPLLPTIHTHSQ